MIVLDASVIVGILLRVPDAERAAPRLRRAGQSLCAPQLLDVEVLQALRRYALRGELDQARGAEAVALLGAFPLRRYPHEPLVPRIWQLRSNLTAYDAAYVALAELLHAPLLTMDARLAQAPGHGARVELLAPTG